MLRPPTAWLAPPSHVTMDEAKPLRLSAASTGCPFRAVTIWTAPIVMRLYTQTS